VGDIKPLNCDLDEPIRCTEKNVVKGHGIGRKYA